MLRFSWFIEIHELKIVRYFHKETNYLPTLLFRRNTSLEH